MLTGVVLLYLVHCTAPARLLTLHASTTELPSVTD